ncbi:MAG: DUF3631 domain-containing protein, partial [Halothiobacillaceae bacterium]|nr:DUF3631 domain-containing protein [Halothiobacillaceae bacterium]
MSTTDLESAIDALLNDAAQSPEPTTDTAPTPENINAVVAHLATLPPLEYEQRREAEAKRFGIRASALDSAVHSARKGSEPDKATMFKEVAPWPSPVDPHELLDDVLRTIQTFIVCEIQTAIAAALWIVFTYFIHVVDVAPLATITAPEKRCGKSQLLDLIGRLCFRALVASNISSAAVYRVIEAHSPTLLIDEADSFMKENEELRGIINSGHTRRSAFVIRTVGDDHEPKQFSTWGAKAISGIGHLSETLMDRSIVLELRRKLPTESVMRLRHADPGLFEELNSRLVRLAQDAEQHIKHARPNLPSELNDRAQDNWEPLLAIADYAGGAWPELARSAALKISGSESESASLNEELLADIQEAFTTRKTDKMHTHVLIAALTGDELRPWANFNRGKPINPSQIAKRLAGYGVKLADLR